MAAFVGICALFVLLPSESSAYTLKGAIGAKYRALGSSKSYLGNPTSDEIKLGTGGVYQQFQKGRIYWKSSTGAWALHGAIYTKYAAFHGSSSHLGYPTSDELNLKSGGVYQKFEKGRIYWKSSLGAWSLHGAIYKRYTGLGGSGSHLGYPASEEVKLNTGGVYQKFEKGRIYWNSKTGAWDIHGAIGNTFIGLGASASSLGYPTSSERKLTTGGRYQSFEKGRIYWRSNTGAWALHGAIGKRFSALGATKSALGYPTSNEIKLKSGGVRQKFQGGYIYWKSSTGAWEVRGGIGNTYIKLGASISSLGYPTSSERRLSTGGRYQSFEKGRIYWRSDTGAWALHGAIGKRFSTLGATKSKLGYPTSNEFRLKSGGARQRFQGGNIYWKSNTGAWETHGAIGRKHITLGGGGSTLGYPTSREITQSGGGVYQKFENGRIYWTKKTGIRVVQNAPTYPGSTAASLRAAEWARVRMGQVRAATENGYWSGWCLKFVQDAWDAAGVSTPRLDAASNLAAHFRARGRTTTPPRGAMVFWPNIYAPYGHVAIADGSGGIYSTMGGIGDRLANAQVQRSHFGSGWFWVLP